MLHAANKSMMKYSSNLPHMNFEDIVQAKVYITVYTDEGGMK